MRFTVRVESSSVNYCAIIDTEAAKYNMPERAVSLYMRETEAREVAKILNREWIHFLNHPT